MYIVDQEVEVSPVRVTELLAEGDDVVVGPGPFPLTKPLDLADPMVHLADGVDQVGLKKVQRSVMI